MYLGPIVTVTIRFFVSKYSQICKFVYYQKNSQICKFFEKLTKNSKNLQKRETYKKSIWTEL